MDKINFRSQEFKLEFGRYKIGDSLSITFIDQTDGEMYLSATTNIPGLSFGEVAIKNYSGNEGVLECLIENKIIKPPHKYMGTGFVNIPVCELTESVSEYIGRLGI